MPWQENVFGRGIYSDPFATYGPEAESKFAYASCTLDLLAPY